MKNLEKIKDKLMGELDELARKPEMSAGDLETIHKLTDTVKNIDKICMYEDTEYSGDYDGGMWEAMGSYENGSRGGNRGGMGNGRSNRGSSYARRRRDSMGRYSRDDGEEEMLEQLKEMMHETDDSRVKSAIKRCITEIEKD